MRLHELDVTAFGPFADTVHVDLDRLAETGLFLLTGDTGAGKSSVLDAICFALYGEVPGDRASARHLRSDHAAPEAEPRVVLRFTVADRTFRISRSPAWDRPRRRGEGTRRVQAHVVVEEWRAGEWHALTTRLDEAGHLVTELLGMNVGQFTQVVLLPQGRFQAFLRSSPTERQAVLQRLFRTRRFEDVERWLAERRTDLGRRSKEHHDRCAAVVARLLEAAPATVLEAAAPPVRPTAAAAVTPVADGDQPLDLDLGLDLGLVGRPVPEPAESSDGARGSGAPTTPTGPTALAAPAPPLGPPDPVDLEPAVLDGSLLRWVRHARAVAAEDEARSTRRARRARAALTRQREGQDAARAHALARRRAHDATAVLDHAAATRDDAEARSRRVELHDRAADLAPLVARVDRARTSVGSTAGVQERRLAALPDRTGLPVTTYPTTHPTTDPADEEGAAELDRWRREVDGALAVARAWLPREQELVRLRTTARAAAARHRELSVAAERHGTEAQEAAAALAAAEEEQAHLDEAAREVPADQEAVGAAARGLESARRAARLRTEVEALREQLVAATARAQDLREHWLDLREQRVSGMAAELATGLVAGCGCPVCGSAEHPAPAHGSRAVDRAEEDDARTRHEEADFERQAVQEMVTTRGTELALAAGAAEGGDVDAWTARHDEAVERCRLSTRAAAAATAGRARLERLRSESTASAHAQVQTRARLETAAAEVRDLEARVADAQGEVDELLAGDLGVRPGSGSVADLVAGLSDLASRLDAAVTAAEEHARARAALRDAEQALEEATDEAGLAGVEAVREALLDARELVDTRAWLQRRQDATAAARSVLAEPAVLDALARDAADLDELEARVAAAERTSEEHHVAARRAGERVRRLEQLSDELGELLAAWEPVRAEHAVLARLTSLVAGTSSDNRWRMRLSAYVLGERLRQVVDAANERLVGMTDERYTLEQVDEKGAGQRRGGLGLLVRDEWSGTRRDPATLSGGESFVVSLALALGLADVVTHEAGGTQLDTLFIDEGFGSLDATTLDHVMDTLDALRDGGRVVGLVSHVAELRTRIPAQLQVRKGRHGSQVEHGVGLG